MTHSANKPCRTEHQASSLKLTIVRCIDWMHHSVLVCVTVFLFWPPSFCEGCSLKYRFSSLSKTALQDVFGVLDGFFSPLSLCCSYPKRDTGIPELMSGTPSPSFHSSDNMCCTTTFTDEIARCSSHPPHPCSYFLLFTWLLFLDLSSVFHRYQKGIYAFGIRSRGDVWMFWSELSLQPSECRLRPIDFCLMKGSDANLYGTHTNTLEASTSCMIGSKRFPITSIMWSCMCTIKTGFRG